MREEFGWESRSRREGFDALLEYVTHIFVESEKAWYLQKLRSMVDLWNYRLLELPTKLRKSRRRNKSDLHVTGRRSVECLADSVIIR